eukprot:3047401-Rhodomonas_salina.1
MEVCLADIVVCESNTRRHRDDAALALFDFRIYSTPGGGTSATIKICTKPDLFLLKYNTPPLGFPPRVPGYRVPRVPGYAGTRVLGTSLPPVSASGTGSQQQQP